MIEYYDQEGDGMDPGLGELAYDGAEYELDEFGERIGNDDIAPDQSIDSEMEDDLASDDTSESDMSSAGKVENGFGEIIQPENQPNLGQQLEDEKLHDEAESDYLETDEESKESKDS